LKESIYVEEEEEGNKNIDNDDDIKEQ